MDEDLADAAASIAAFAARPSFRFAEQELVDAIRDLHAVTSAATGVLAGLVHDAVAWEVPKEHDATSAVTWLRDLLRVTPAEARTLSGLGGLFASRPRLADAVTSGVLNVSQAAAIGQVLDDVPDFAAAANSPGGVEAGSGDGEPTEMLDSADSAPDPGDGIGAAPIGGRSLVDDVEAELVRFAVQFEPRYLRQLGQRILAHVNPDLADQRLRERLDREERHSRARRGFTMSPDGFGGIRLFGRLDVEAAAAITAAISPLTVPVTDADGPDLRTAAARRADALVDVCRLALRTGDLPAESGTPTQVVVTIDWDALSRDVAVGQLDTGISLTPSTTRRLACDAGILPVVLNGASVPIDVGRSRRPFTGAARQAVLIRDGGCAFPGCDRPSRWCDVHHVIFWSSDGPTNRDNGVALCSYHHRLIHRPDAGWRLVMASDHRPDFIPPAHIDPKQRPRRNPYHPRT